MKILVLEHFLENFDALVKGKFQESIDRYIRLGEKLNLNGPLYTYTVEEILVHLDTWKKMLGMKILLYMQDHLSAIGGANNLVGRNRIQYCC